MMNSKLNFLFKVLIVFPVSLFIFNTSCKKDDSPEYVGTWVGEKYYPAGGGYGGYAAFKDILTINETSYLNILQKQISGGKWDNYESIEGSLSTDGSIMNLTISELRSYYYIFEAPRENVEIYKKEDANFETILLNKGKQKSFSWEYNVSGKKLTIKIDNNKDGDFSDLNETIEYTKQ